MLINKDTKIVGKKCILVPYRREHVLKYHEWMKSEELQKLTASEPLSLEEEYAMQKSWMVDENKCTFIILDKELFESTANEVSSMIGDTNLFFANCDDRLCAEAEIMIAENRARGKKCGKEAMLLMFLYGIQHLSVKQYIVKISMDNDVSLNMFNSFGFMEVGISVVFKEITLSKVVDNEWISWLESNAGQLEIVKENSELKESVPT